MATTMNLYHHHILTTSNYQTSTANRFQAFHETAEIHKPLKKTSRLAESISNMLHLHIDTPAQRSVNYMPSLHVDVVEKHNTPTMSPKEDISDKWRQIQGSSGWGELLDPLHPCLRREIIKYGEFAQATYDAFDFDSLSEYCGSCRFNRKNLLDKLGLGNRGYNVSKYIYAMSHVEVPRWLERSHVMDSWSKDSNWMGYVAVSDDNESRRIGRRDIVVAWRGTVAPSEWYEDLQRKLAPIGDGEARVEHGFLSIITGHSLGGALAVLNAYETATLVPNVPITVVSFGAPRVGNVAFRDELHKKGVKTLRVVVKQDFVPRMPGIVLNESLHLVDGFVSTKSSFRTEAKRDVALVNKACNMLLEDLKIPHFWYQVANKGLVCNSHGRWVKPRRDPEDVPSPIALASLTCIDV